MNSLDKQYHGLLKTIMDYGVNKRDRTGTGTKSIFGYTIRHNMSEGFPLLTTKKVYWKGIVTELLWFLRGDTNIKYLVDNGCNIWNGDAYKNYVLNLSSIGIHDVLQHDNLLTQDEFMDKIKTDDEFAKEWGDLGPIYGKMWRDWDEDTGGKIDQIQNLINDLNTNPDSRRLMVNAWNPTYLPHMTLPPCHYGFQVYTRELDLKERQKISNHKVDTHKKLDSLRVPKRTLSLMWNQRSVDTFLGLPFNIASYGLLLEIISKEVNMVPENLIGNLGDTHLYNNHFDQVKKQLNREGMSLPEVRLRNYDNLEELLTTQDSMKEIQLWHYDSHPSINAPLSN